MKRLAEVLKKQLIVFAFLLCAVLSVGMSYAPRRWFRSTAGLWPLLLLSGAGFAMYLLVWLEARYVASFEALILLVLLVKLMTEKRVSLPLMSPLRRGALYLTIIAAGCAGTLLATQHDEDRNVWGNLVHHETYSNSDQWRAGMYLKQIGMAPGDQVAVISDLLNASRCTWAYVADLKIIGELNGDLAPYASDDFDVFWHAAPAEQHRILEMFHQAGAKMVFAQSRPDDAPASGWASIPGTKFWIYRF